MLKKLLKNHILGLILGLLILPSFAIGQAIFITPQGGTGTGLVPDDGDILVGNPDGAYTPTPFTSMTVTEAMLNAVNSPTDELCLTYEATVGDFEWQTCSTGGGDSVSIDGSDVADPDFVSSGDIDFVNTSNTITALINAGSIIEPDLNADVAPADGDFLQYDSTGTNFTWRSASELISDIGLGNVENTALSTWAGTTNLTTLGAITTGTWQATSLTDSYVSDILTIGASGSVDDGALSANVSLLGSTIAPSELAIADFGDFTCNGTSCSLDASYLTTVDISDNSNLAVSSPITLTGDTVGINQSLLSITESQISDLGAYLTSVDISGNTNLAVSSPLTLTGDTVGINQSLLSITESQISDLGSYLTTVDISANTNLTGGRSLTLTGDSLEADPELYTDNKTWWIENPTDTDDFQNIFENDFGKDLTIVEISCESDQTVNLDLQVDDGTPADVNGTDIVCNSTGVDDTSFAGDSTISDNETIDLAITSVAGTPTWVSITMTYTIGD